MNFTVSLDEKTRFPLIEIPNLNYKVQWLPVTKIQLEYFLSSVSDSAYDAQWYDRILQGNQRVSPGNIRSSNYWGAIATNVLPKECRRFAEWMGHKYRLMEGSEWLNLYNYTKQQPANLEFVKQITSMDGVNERTRLLIENIENASQQAFTRPKEERTLAHQMLALLGVIEYVYTDDARNQYGGLGDTPPQLFSSLAKPDTGVQQLTDPINGMRMQHYGFRLIQEV